MESWVGATQRCCFTRSLLGAVSSHSPWFLSARAVLAAGHPPLVCQHQRGGGTCWQQRRFGRAKASELGLELGHASPVALTSCLGQDNNTHMMGRCDSAQEGSSHRARKGLIRTKLQVPSTTHESIQSHARHARPPGQDTVLAPVLCCRQKAVF